MTGLWTTVLLAEIPKKILQKTMISFDDHGMYIIGIIGRAHLDPDAQKTIIFLCSIIRRRLVQYRDISGKLEKWVMNSSNPGLLSRGGGML